MTDVADAQASLEATYLDLGFDVDIEVLRAGQRRRVQESAVLHAGHCVHVNVLKEFM